MILVTGGARCGKSAFAEQYAAHIGSKGIYIATSQIIDDEMERRIELHRAKRREAPIQWETYEEPYDLADRIQRLNDELKSDADTVVLVDCMSIWLSNWQLSYERAETEYEHQDEAQRRILAKIEQLVDAITSFEGHMILVTTEVGDSIVPQQRLGRRFRDAVGLMNQFLAAQSDQVFLVTAGIPVDIKKLAFTFDE